MGREALHLGADLRQNLLGDPTPDSRDRVEKLQQRLKRGEPPLDLGIEPFDSGLDLRDVGQLLLEEEPLVRTD